MLRSNNCFLTFVIVRIYYSWGNMLVGVVVFPNELHSNFLISAKVWAWKHAIRYHYTNCTTIFRNTIVYTYMHAIIISEIKTYGLEEEWGGQYGIAWGRNRRKKWYN